MMDRVVSRDRDFEIDLEKGVRVSEHDLGKDSSSSVQKPGKTLLAKVCGGFPDGSSKGENGLHMSGIALNSVGTSVEKLEVVSDNVEVSNNVDSVGNRSVKEKRKKNCNKKAPKPPRPPTGPRLDAADQKLVKEIAEVAMLKRARIERMKAVRKMKASKSSSYSGNVLATVFTILFFLVIIFQGMSSSSTDLKFQGSPLTAEPMEANLVSVEFYAGPSVTMPYGPDSESPNLIEQVSGSDPQENLRRDVG